MYSGEDKVKYFEDIMNLSHDVMILSLWISVLLKYSQNGTSGL